MLKYDLSPTEKQITISIKLGDYNEEFTTSVLSSLNKKILSPQVIDGVEEDVLEGANLFFKSLDDNTQRSLFEVTKSIHERLQLYPGNMDIIQACDFCHIKIKDLLDNPKLKMNHLVRWCKDNIPVPDTIDDKFTIENRRMGHTREQTYLKDEYVELTALALMLKILFPIIYNIQCFSASSRVISSKKARDTYLLNTITYSVFPSEITEFSGFKRLEAFVKQTTKRNTLSASKIIDDAMTTENKLRYTTSIVLLSKLILSTLLNANGKKNLASHLYSSIYQLYRVNLRMEVKTKHFSGTSGEIEYSQTEMYHDSEKYFIHDQVAMRHTGGLNNLISCYKSDIVVGSARAQYKELTSVNMHQTKIQEAIASNVLRWVVAPDAYLIMKHREFNACCVVASELIKDKYPLLALIYC